ncbi:MAG: hypothetical protein OJF61_001641 [Rhodanobacteraceae bacterium]|nr:MAG: hypothetical protein OJF61_001641 [Rhodanobacteraceae bacterium]
MSLVSRVALETGAVRAERSLRGKRSRSTLRCPSTPALRAYAQGER